MRRSIRSDRFRLPGGLAIEPIARAAPPMQLRKRSALGSTARILTLRRPEAPAKHTYNVSLRGTTMVLDRSDGIDFATRMPTQ